MRTVLTILTIILSIILILGILIGLQQIITYQAQIAFDEYQDAVSTQQKLNADTYFKTSSATSP
jgi:phosphotransferase system  glucose/maltose/N-acetylglucosamine-specific IIC component